MDEPPSVCHCSILGCTQSYDTLAPNGWGTLVYSEDPVSDGKFEHLAEVSRQRLCPEHAQLARESLSGLCKTDAVC